MTPFGRYYFNRLPFGITSAPEHFQRQMIEILKDCDNTVCHMDDMLVWGTNEYDHNTKLQAVFETLRAAGVSLNVQEM